MRDDAGNNLLEGPGLASIQLTYLGRLYLSGNNITTCECLARAYLPSLRFLSICTTVLIEMKIRYRRGDG